jgi:hypothetical protein
VWLVIFVVIQSTTERPPLQLKLSTRRGLYQPNLRQSLFGVPRVVLNPCPDLGLRRTG